MPARITRKKKKEESRLEGVRKAIDKTEEKKKKKEREQKDKKKREDASERERGVVGSAEVFLS